MLETSARLLRLLSLLQAHREWSGADLADRLGVTPRTVRRDVDRLRELGYPVNASPGTGGGYQLGAGAELPPLLLDDEEAVAVAVGLRQAAGQGIEGIGETSVRALAKLEQVLPHRLRRRVGALTAFTVPMLRGPQASVVDPGVLTELANACRDCERVRFEYLDHGGSPTRRTVEPHRLVCSERRWYLFAWDVDRDDWRTFRVDRITPRPPHGPRFTPRTPPAGDLAAHVARGVSTRAYASHALVRLLVPLQEAPDDGLRLRGARTARAPRRGQDGPGPSDGRSRPKRVRGLSSCTDGVCGGVTAENTGRCGSDAGDAERTRGGASKACPEPTP
jgi:predicted DNA-binding transcriptional regulator YafY